MSTQSIQPVTRRFPVSLEVWEDTNLPFSCVLTPLAPSPTAAEKDASTSSSSSRNKSSSRRKQVYSLASIPKCLHCGAPHANSSTHYSPKKGLSSSSFPSPLNNYHQDSFLLCYLCGKTSSTSLEQQQEKRREESLKQQQQQQQLRSPPYFDSVGGGETFELPLRLSSPSSSVCYSIPALACPPLWFIVLDGSCSNPLYWQTLSQQLLQTLETMPPHVHVSLLMTSCTLVVKPPSYSLDSNYYSHRKQRRNNDYNNYNSSNDYYDSSVLVPTLSIWQLQSPLPHVLDFAMNSLEVDLEHARNANAAATNATAADDDIFEETMVENLLQGVVPGSSPHIATAFRSLVDYRPPSSTTATTGGGGAEFVVGPALEWTINAIVSAVTDIGQPVGQRRSSSSSTGDAGIASDGTSTRTSSGTVAYAGGKITCFLANTPSSLFRAEEESSYLPTSNVLTNPPVVGRGGVGGRIGVEPVGMRFDSNKIKTNKMMEDEGNNHNNSVPEWTPSQLQSRYFSNKNAPNASSMVDLIEELGRACALAALGVDLLCLVDCGIGGEGSDDDDGYYPLPDDTTTIPDFGLCLFGSLSLKSGAPGPLVLDLRRQVGSLQREIAARTPWRSHVVFGGELRLRLSPGFVVDDSPVERVVDQHGPQLAPMYADQGMLGPGSAVEESPNLWRMGVCDPYTSFTIDLAVRRPHTQVLIDGFGEVSIKPVLQTCFAYTTILQNEAGEYHTVRQMRIHSCPVPLARDTETIYASLDPEALAVVLFHKLALATFQDGVTETSAIADDWLQSTLVSVYQSAERYIASRNADANENNNGNTSIFLPNERLLDREGELSAEQVLLAQGHDRLRSIPLMTYLLMQCDAFRHSPCSLDLRYAALCQIMSMTPTNLTRCIAPRIQLWSSAKDEVEPILDVVDLRADAIAMAVQEYSMYDLIFLIDTPYMIAVIDGQYWGNSGSSSVDDGKSKTSRSSLPLVLGPALKRAISDVAHSYRTSPTIVYELSHSPASRSRAVGHLVDVLVGDAPSPNNHANFDAWKADLAVSVQEEIEKSSSSK